MQKFCEVEEALLGVVALYCIVVQCLSSCHGDVAERLSFSIPQNLTTVTCTHHTLLQQTHYHKFIMHVYNNFCSGKRC